MLLLFGAFAALGVFTGRTRFYRAYARAEQPVAYWGVIALWSFMAFVGAYRFVQGFPPS